MGDNGSKYAFDYVVCSVLLLGHILFFAIFAALQIGLLAFLSLAGVFIYAVCFILLKYRMVRIGLMLCVLELAVVVCFDTVYLGWASGFHFYVLSLAPVIFLTDVVNYKIKTAVTAACIALYIAIHQAFIPVTPVVTLPDTVLAIFHDFNIVVVFISITIILYYYRRTVIKSENKLHENMKKLARLAETDQLTQLFNRRYILNAIENEMLLYAQRNVPFIVAIADIDGFKTVNDTCGHEAGDQVMIDIGHCIKDEIRENDIVARWGGDEFLLFLPQTGLAGGITALEKVRLAIAGLPFNIEGSLFNVTVTIGGAVYNGNDEMKNLIKTADKHLYAGKLAGKNRVVFGG